MNKFTNQFPAHDPASLARAIAERALELAAEPPPREAIERMLAVLPQRGIDEPLAAWMERIKAEIGRRQGDEPQQSSTPEALRITASIYFPRAAASSGEEKFPLPDGEMESYPDGNFSLRITPVEHGAKLLIQVRAFAAGMFEFSHAKAVLRGIRTFPAEAEHDLDLWRHLARTQTIVEMQLDEYGSWEGEIDNTEQVREALQQPVLDFL